MRCRTVSTCNAWLAIIACLLLGACASPAFNSHDRRLAPLLQRAASGDAAGAAAVLPTPDNDVLALLEKGELLRHSGQFEASSQLWREAHDRLAAADLQGVPPQQWLDASLQYLVNDKVRPYSVHDFERVLISSRLALNHIALGQWKEARIEVRKAHELEARIAEQHRRREQKLLEEKGRRPLPELSQIGGYPVELIDAPEVRALKNSYQSAFSHYLAGFVYEALGENSLAAAGYRQAIELQGPLPVLEDGLRMLDSRSGLNDGRVDTLIVLEAAWAPARRARNFTVPVPYWAAPGYLSYRLASISFPVLQYAGPMQTDGWQLDTVPLDLDLVTDIGLMSRRALRDEMPMIMLRTSARAISRWAVSSSLDRQPQGSSGVGFALASSLLQLGGAVMEQADDRCWRSLPGRFYLARVRLAPGRHEVAVPGLAPLHIDLAAAPRQQVVVLRWLDRRLTRIQ